jgi:hypothetical protein
MKSSICEHISSPNSVPIKKGYMVQLPKSAKIPKNSVIFNETANERIFLMKDLAVEEALSLGGKIAEGEVAF